MSWNASLQINNLATKLNNLSKSVITNPLTSTLNANTHGDSFFTRFLRNRDFLGLEF